MTIEVPLNNPPSKVAERVAEDLTLLLTRATKDRLEAVDILLLSAVGYSAAGTLCHSQATGESRLNYLRERIEYLHEFLIGRAESSPESLELIQLVKNLTVPK